MGEMWPMGRRCFRPEALVMEVAIVVVPCKEENQSVITLGHV